MPSTEQQQFFGGSDAGDESERSVTVSFSGESTADADETDAKDGDGSEATEDESDDSASVTERFEVGDRVENPSQRHGTEYKVVNVGREKKPLAGEVDILKVERADGRGRVDEIPEHYHENWRLAQ